MYIVFFKIIISNQRQFARYNVKLACPPNKFDDDNDGDNNDDEKQQVSKYTRKTKKHLCQKVMQALTVRGNQSFFNYPFQ